MQTLGQGSQLVSRQEENLTKCPSEYVYSTVDFPHPPACFMTKLVINFTQESTLMKSSHNVRPTYHQVI